MNRDDRDGPGDTSLALVERSHAFQRTPRTSPERHDHRRAGQGSAKSIAVVVQDKPRSPQPERASVFIADRRAHRLPGRGALCQESGPHITLTRWRTGGVRDLGAPRRSAVGTSVGDCRLRLALDFGLRPRRVRSNLGLPETFQPSSTGLAAIDPERPQMPAFGGTRGSVVMGAVVGTPFRVSAW